MKFITKRVAVADTALTVGAASNVSAAVITNDVVVNNQDWRVSILEADTFENIASLLTSQIWFGNYDLAFDFAFAFGPSDDSVNADTIFGDRAIGALFAYEADSTNSGFRATWCSSSFGCVDGDLLGSSTDLEYRFAVAERIDPIPLPAGLSLLLTGLAGFGVLRLRKKQTAKA